MADAAAGTQCPGGLVYHVLNRAVASPGAVQKDGDYAAFERVLAEAFGENTLMESALRLKAEELAFFTR